jgi:hypothetical protein
LILVRGLTYTTRQEPQSRVIRREKSTQFINVEVSVLREPRHRRRPKGDIASAFRAPQRARDEFQGGRELNICDRGDRTSKAPQSVFYLGVRAKLIHGTEEAL